MSKKYLSRVDLDQGDVPIKGEIVALKIIITRPSEQDRFDVGILQIENADHQILADRFVDCKFALNIATFVIVLDQLSRKRPKCEHNIHNENIKFSTTTNKQIFRKHLNF